MVKVNKIVAAGLSVALFVGVSAPAANAVAKPATVKTFATAESINKINWSDVARKAEATGDQDVAKFAQSRAALEEVRSSGIVLAKPAGIVGVSKKVVLWTLEHSAHLFPAKVRPYIFKITSVVRKVSLKSEQELIIAFQLTGIPYDVAKDAAWFIMHVIL